MKYYIPLVFFLLVSCSQSENNKASSTESENESTNKIKNDSIKSIPQPQVDSSNKDTLFKHKSTHFDRKTIYKIKMDKINNNKKLQELEKQLMH